MIGCDPVGIYPAFQGIDTKQTIVPLQALSVLESTPLFRGLIQAPYDTLFFPWFSWNLPRFSGD